MTFKAKVVMVSENGKEWSVVRRDYVTSDVNPETGKGFAFGTSDFIQGVLEEGDNLLLKEEESKDVSG